MLCEMVISKKSCVVAYSGQLVGGVIHLPAIVQSEESLEHGFPFFGIFEAGTIGGRLPVEHRFKLLLRDP